MLIRVVGRVAASGLDGVIVVTQRRLADELGLDGREDVLVVANEDADSAMIDSVLLGADAAVSAHGAGQDDGVLVLPGDCPGVGSATIRACGDLYRSGPGRIVVAVHGGRRGHPLVFPVGLLGSIRSLAASGGLNQLLGDRPDLVCELDCGDAGVLRDVDTPGDYGADATGPAQKTDNK